MMRGNVTFRRPALACWMVSPAPQVMTRATASPGAGGRVGLLHQFERQVRTRQHHRLHVKPSKPGPPTLEDLAGGPNRL